MKHCQIFGYSLAILQPFLATRCSSRQSVAPCAARNDVSDEQLNDTTTDSTKSSEELRMSLIKSKRGRPRTVKVTKKRKLSEICNKSLCLGMIGAELIPLYTAYSLSDKDFNCVVHNFERTQCHEYCTAFCTLKVSTMGTFPRHC